MKMSSNIQYEASEKERAVSCVAVGGCQSVMFVFSLLLETSDIHNSSTSASRGTLIHTTIPNCDHIIPLEHYSELVIVIIEGCEAKASQRSLLS